MMNNGSCNNQNDNDSNTKQSTVSPLVTAQDRKRKILERRRKEQQQQQQQQQQQDDQASNAALLLTTASETSAFSLKRRRSETNENLTPKMGSGASLFGAVMQRTSSGSGSIIHAASTTPKKQQARIADAAWNQVSTPSSSSSSRSKSFLSANSPCGFALLKVLESVASPFRAHKQDDNDEKESPATNVDAKMEEWQEAFLNDNSIGIVDWSMKRKVRLECHPGSCLPSTTSDALSYWQHPALYPLPPVLKESNDDFSQSTREGSASMHHSSAGVVEMVRGRNALLHRLVRNDESVWRLQRNREWQQAFSSLFSKWIHQVEALQEKWHSKDESVSAQNVVQTYFYAIAPGQTILFRTRVSDGQLTPMVVLSCTTQAMRSKLRSMGVKLLYYHDSNIEFDETVLEKKKPKKAKTTSDDDINPNEETVHEELEALRRAQAHGETAGADVSIANKKSGSTSSMRNPTSIPPLCLVGEDDCWAFHEFYLNTLGHNTTWLKNKGDVPLLLTRKIGPFLHSTLKSVQATSRREPANHSSSNQREHDNHAAIELRGTILPCTLQEFVCTAASQMMQDTTTVSPKTVEKNEDDVGSHYFVVQSQVYEGQERPKGMDSSTSTGTASSRLLNNGTHLSTAIATDNGPTECEHGQVVSMIVWDIARPNMVAYKTETK